MTEKEETVTEPEEITCSGGVRLPLLNQLRERPQAEEDGEDE